LGRGDDELYADDAKSAGGRGSHGRLSGAGGWPELSVSDKGSLYRCLLFRRKCRPGGGSFAGLCYPHPDQYPRADQYANANPAANPNGDFNARPHQHAGADKYTEADPDFAPVSELSGFVRGLYAGGKKRWEV
jgi:hypothetical protein